MFTSTTGMTIHDYVQRRQLTEAAKLLVFSRKSILEVALICGYESQQSFSSAFKSMYKITPAEYRNHQEFYPLQLRFTLCRDTKSKEFTRDDICLAEQGDIPAWMEPWHTPPPPAPLTFWEFILNIETGDCKNCF